MSQQNVSYQFTYNPKQRSRLLYSRYLYGSLNLDDYVNEVIRVKKIFLVAHALSLEKYEHPLFMTHLYYDDNVLYIPYFSDYLDCTQDRFFVGKGERKYFRGLEYFDELIEKVNHLSLEELDVSYKHYLEKLITSNKVLLEKPDYKRYRNSVRFSINLSQASVFRYYIIPILSGLMIPMITLVFIMSNSFPHLRKDRFQIIFFLTLFILGFVYYLVGLRKLFRPTLLERKYFM